MQLSWFFCLNGAAMETRWRPICRYCVSRSINKNDNVLIQLKSYEVLIHCVLRNIKEFSKTEIILFMRPRRGAINWSLYLINWIRWWEMRFHATVLFHFCCVEWSWQETKIYIQRQMHLTRGIQTVTQKLIKFSL